MPPGRRKSLCTKTGVRESPINDTSACVAEREFTNGSAAKNPQVSRRTTRSSIHSQQVGYTAQPIQDEHVGPSIPSSAQTEQHEASNVQSEEPNDTMSSQARSGSLLCNLLYIYMFIYIYMYDIVSCLLWNIYVDQNVRQNPRKATRGMMTSKMARAASTGKLSVTFDANCRQPICINAERFNNEIGFIVRNHGTFSYKEWRLVPEHVRAPLRNYLLVNSFTLTSSFIVYTMCEHLGLYFFLFNFSLFTV